MKSGTQTRWLPLGEGTYNHVSVSPEPNTLSEDKATPLYWIRKDPKDGIGAILATATRAVNNFKRLYPDIPACLSDDGSWKMAYIAGTQPTDTEIAKAVVDIYARTRCIILDGCNPTNFIKRTDGAVICIDVDMLYHAHDKLMLDFMKTYMTGKHRLRYNYPGYLKRMATQHNMHETVHAINVLLFLERGRGQHVIPDLSHYEFIQEFDFDWNNIPISHAIEEEKMIPVTSPETEQPSPTTVHKHKLATTTHDLFLKLHQHERGWFDFFYKHFTQVKSTETQTLANIVQHAQQDKRVGGRPVRSALLLQRMGWFNERNEVIAESGLDQALRAETGVNSFLQRT